MQIVFLDRCCLLDAKVEARLIVQALRVNTLSKLTFSDAKRFDSLVRDVFPDVPFRDIEYEKLEAALRAACEESNLTIIKSQVLGNDQNRKKASRLTFDSLGVQSAGVVRATSSTHGRRRRRSVGIWKEHALANLALGARKDRPKFEAVHGES